jgi:glycosyltransferase involved in cell wall biosynthesis
VSVTHWRALILNERDPRHPRAGGAEVHVAEIFGRLAQRGHEVVLASCGFAGAPARETLQGLQVWRLGRLPLYYPRAAWACARSTRAGRFDVVIECLNKLPFLAPLYARVPVLGLCHHLFGETAFRQVAWPLAATVVAIEKQVPRVFAGSRFAAISESTRDDLLRRGVAPDRIEVHHPGIRWPACEPLPLAARGRRIVCVGRVERYKRVDVLLRALQRLLPRFPDAELVVVGSGSDRVRLERLAGELGVASRVRFSGFVDGALRDRLVASARVSACASEKEGWGLTVIESSALGTPVVASDAPGLRDSVRDGETGFLAPTGDVHAFAERIGALLADDALAQRTGLAARAFARRFDWERAADQMEGALARVLGCSRIPHAARALS